MSCIHGRWALIFFFFFSSRRRHTRFDCDWSSDVCSSDLKTIRYGGATEDEALRMITLNPAWIIGVDDRVGSLDVGKDADIAIWNGHPLSSYGRVEKVLIDGSVFFDVTAGKYGLQIGRASCR